MKAAALWLAVAATVTFCVGPFAWQVVTSVTPEARLTSGELPSSLTAASYAGVFEGRPFARVIGNSLAVAALTTLLCLAFAVTAAFALAVLRPRLRPWLLGGALAASMFPPIATVSPLFLAIRALGLRDTVPGLVLPYVSFALPLALWVMTSFLEDLPPELYRAARVDGCTPWQAFTRVLLPLSGPGLFTTALFVFIFSWNEFLFALTFTSSPEARTIPVAISLFASAQKEPWGEMAAASVIVTLPLLILTLLFQRRVVRGLTSGAVKG